LDEPGFGQLTLLAARVDCRLSLLDVLQEKTILRRALCELLQSRAADLWGADFPQQADALQASADIGRGGQDINHRRLRHGADLFQDSPRFCVVQWIHYRPRDRFDAVGIAHLAKNTDRCRVAKTRLTENLGQFRHIFGCAPVFQGRDQVAVAQAVRPIQQLVE